jgi:hypothetical protein
VIGPYLIACTLLVLAGTSKALRPANTARALAQLFPPASLWVVAVPLLATGECVLGVSAIIWPVPVLASAVAASYAVFAAFIIVIRLRHGAVSSCGCFGTPDTPDTPATWLHAVINAALAVASIVVAVQAPAGDIVAILREQPLHGAPLVFAVLVGSWLVVLSFSTLAQLSAVRHALGGGPGGSGGSRP